MLLPPLSPKGVFLPLPLPPLPLLLLQMLAERIQAAEAMDQEQAVQGLQLLYCRWAREGGSVALFALQVPQLSASLL